VLAALPRSNKGVRELLPLTSEQRAKAEERLRNPAPGSRIGAAQQYGISLSLLIEQLRLTPTVRGGKLESASIAIEKVRGAARKRC
jgi:hypothetical protein